MYAASVGTSLYVMIPCNDDREELTGTKIPPGNIRQNVFFDLRMAAGKHQNIFVLLFQPRMDGPYGNLPKFPMTTTSLI